MRKIFSIISIIVLLTGGLVIMATSEQNIKNVDRKVYYGTNVRDYSDKGKPILEDSEILDVNGTTYVPLRALCESMRKQVEWDASKNEILISDEEWDYSDEVSSKIFPHIMSTIAIPDAETAFKIADIMFRNCKGLYSYLKARGSAENVWYDEKYDAWVVIGEVVITDPENYRGGIKDVPDVIVLRKDNGEVIAFW